MIMPILFLLGGLFAVLAYFARKNVTWDTRRNTQGSLGMAFVVFIIAAIMFYGFDIWLDWSLIPQYMLAAGGALTFIAYAFFAGFGLLCISMIVSASKVGTMVA